MPEPTAGYAPRPSSRISVGQVFAFVAGFVALAAIGALIGWNLTDGPPPKTNAGPPPPSPSVTAVSSPPSSAPSSAPATTVSGFVIPDYHAQGKVFVDARQDLIDHKLAVTLTFNAVSDDPAGTVVRTEPPAGTPVAKGITVKMNVVGPPPTLQVRQTQGESCAQAGRELAGDGLIVSYYKGKSGKVAMTDPAAGAPNVTWNQHINIYCTPDGQLPPSGPASPSSAPSGNPGG